MPDLIVGRYLLDPSFPSSLRGGYGDVFICRDRLSQQRVVVKTGRRPGESAQRSPDVGEVWASIRREGDILARLNHGNIVQLLDRGEWDSCPFLVLQYLPGENLFKMGIAKPRPSLSDIVDALHQAAQALAAVHAAGILHLDIKPENFIRQPDGTVVLFDFGNAFPPAQACVPGPGSVVSKAYSAPEQTKTALLAGTHLTEAADVFSFGVVAFELLTGGHPFGGNDSGVTIRIAEEPVRGELAELVPGIPAPVCNALKFALAKRPQVRPTARALAEQLGAWASSLKSAQLLERANQLLLEGRPAEGADVLGQLLQNHPHDIEVHKEAAKLLAPLAESLLDAGDLVRAEELLGRIESHLLEPAQRLDHIRLKKRLEELSRAKKEVPRLIEKCREMGAHGNHEAATYVLNKALALDPMHPDILGLLRDDLCATDNLWEQGAYTDAMCALRQIETGYRELLSRSEKGRQYIRHQTQMWRTSVLNNCQVLAQAGNTDRLREYLAAVREFVDSDSALVGEIARYFPEAKPAIPDRRPEFTARFTNAITQEDFPAAERALATARSAYPGDAQWAALEATLKAAREATQQRQRAAQEEAERRTREEADRKAREEARIAQQEAARKAQEDAERSTREQADRAAREEAERRAREDAARRTREDAALRTREPVPHTVQPAPRKSPVFIFASAALLIVIGLGAWMYSRPKPQPLPAPRPKLTMLQLKSGFTRSTITALDANRHPLATAPGSPLPGNALSTVQLIWRFPLSAGEESAEVDQVSASLRNGSNVDVARPVTVLRDTANRELRFETPELSPSTGGFAPGTWAIALSYGPDGGEIGAKEFVVAPQLKVVPQNDEEGRRKKAPGKKGTPLAPDKIGDDK